MFDINIALARLPDNCIDASTPLSARLNNIQHD